MKRILSLICVGLMLAAVSFSSLPLRSVSASSGHANGQSPQATALPSTIILSSQCSPFAETTPVTNHDAAGVAQGSVVLHLVQDAAGDVVFASADVIIAALALAASTKITGATVNQGAAGANGAVVIDSGLTAAAPFALTSGSGNDFLFNKTVPLAMVQQLLTDPSTFYFNIVTDGSPTGACRGQLFLESSLSATTPPPFVFATTLFGGNDKPPVTGPDGTSFGIAIVYVQATLDATGAITGAVGEVDVLLAGLPPTETIVGAVVKQGPAGKKTAKAPVVIDGGLTATSPMPLTPVGSATIRKTGLTMTAAAAGAMLGNPAGFFFNIDTSANPTGGLRGQLAQLPAITAASVSGTKLIVDGIGFEKGAKILVDGVAVKTSNNGAKPSTELTAKKEGSAIAIGSIHLLIVQNPSGLVSPGFIFARTQ